MSENNDSPEKSIAATQHLIDESYGDVERLKVILDKIKKSLSISKEDQDYLRNISIQYTNEKENLR